MKWSVDPNQLLHTDEVGVIDDETGAVICTVWPQGSDFDESPPGINAIATAKKIAALPDLIELAQHIASDPNNTDWEIANRLLKRMEIYP